MSASAPRVQFSVRYPAAGGTWRYESRPGYDDEDLGPHEHYENKEGR